MKIGRTAKRDIKTIPADEQIELEKYFRANLAAAGENIKSAMDKLNTAYDDRNEYYATTLKQIQGGNMPLWKFIRMANVLGYDVKWVKRQKE